MLPIQEFDLLTVNWHQIREWTSRAAGLRSLVGAQELQADDALDPTLWLSLDISYSISPSLLLLQIQILFIRLKFRLWFVFLSSKVIQTSHYLCLVPSQLCTIVYFSLNLYGTHLTGTATLGDL